MTTIAQKIREISGDRSAFDAHIAAEDQDCVTTDIHEIRNYGDDHRGAAVVLRTHDRSAGIIKADKRERKQREQEVDL